MTQTTTTKTQKNLNGSFRKVVAVSACLLASGQLMAQCGFDFGLKGIGQGSTLINMQDQAAGPEIDFVTKVHPAGGISAGYTFTKHLGVEINVLYSMQGQDYKGNISQISPASQGIYTSNLQLLATANNVAMTDPYKASVALNYVKIPVLLRFTGNSTKRVYFSGIIGPEMNLLTSVKYKINGTEVKSSRINMASTAAYQTIGVDAVLGLGLGINLNKDWMLAAHLLMDYGLTDAENKSATYSYGANAGKFYDTKRSATNNGTAGVQISVNYKLHKKEKAKTEDATDENGNIKKLKKADNTDDNDADDNDNDDNAKNKKKK